jgi:CDGSH iron-sulfur domain-containing protein 3
VCKGGPVDTTHELLLACNEAARAGLDFPTVWNTLLAKHRSVIGPPIQSFGERGPLLEIRLISGQRIVYHSEANEYTMAFGGTSSTAIAAPPAVVAKRAPYTVDVVAGKTYFWCACGLSQTQPFCDGSHRGTGLAPIAYMPDASRKEPLCGCKQSTEAPHCDGSHMRLPRG